MTKPPTILVVEDEPKLASLLIDYLHAEGFATSHLADGDAVLPYVREAPPDLMLLDLMLPNKSGLDICREVRGFSQLPIIMITARVEEIDRLLGLELGADDYICKPFSPREVVARVKAILRRLQAGGAQAGSRGGPALALVIDEEAFTVHMHGHPLEVTPAEFRLLRLFLRHPNKVFSRDQLLTTLYDDRRVVTDRTVDTHIKNLRRKLEGTGVGEDCIVSIYGVGYKFDPPALPRRDA